MCEHVQVAVKTIVFEDGSAGGAGGQSTALERAIAEGAIALSLSHPNVVATYHHDIKPLRVEDTACGAKLHVEHAAAEQVLLAPVTGCRLRAWATGARRRRHPAVMPSGSHTDATPQSWSACCSIFELCTPGHGALQLAAVVCAWS